MPVSFPVLDTHTGGEITRVLRGESLGLTGGSAIQQREKLCAEFDWVRKALTSEPRGSAFAVGAVVTGPHRESNQWSVVFFNNVGYLGMCGHGLLGVVEALRHWEQLPTGKTEFATPAGEVKITLESDGGVTFTGVPSHCYRRDVAVHCADGTVVSGDIAYGGNWFFLTQHPAVETGSIDQLMRKCELIRDAIDREQIQGFGGAVIDHVELCAPLTEFESNASAPQGCRSFVLCPGGHYDRSPCGTGTSAKLACLAARDKLEQGERWIQESITNSRFLASYSNEGEHVRVSIKGRAHVIAETVQFFDDNDPLRFGIYESELRPAGLWERQP